MNWPVLSILPELKPKQREALENHRTDALRSQQLVTIRTEVPIDIDFEALRYRGASRERCYELFSKLAFRTLVNDYAPTAETIQKDYRLVTSLAELGGLVAALRASGEFAFRVIPDRPSAFRAGIVGIAFSTADPIDPAAEEAKVKALTGGQTVVISRSRSPLSKLPGL